MLDDLSRADRFIQGDVFYDGPSGIQVFMEIFKVYSLNIVHGIIDEKTNKMKTKKIKMKVISFKEIVIIST